MSEENSSTTARRWWHSVWFVVKAIEIRLRFIAVLVGIGLIIGYWDTLRNHWDKWTRPAAGATAGLSGEEEFFCPMHPSVIRDQLDPGGAIPKCPSCGMPLSKRTKGAAEQLPEGVISRRQFSPYRVQLAGIKTVEVARRPLTMNIRTVGTVTTDERRMSRIVVRASGYVEKLYVNESFAFVREGDPLVEIYSPDLYAAAQELLIASRSQRTSLAEIARDKLRLLGVAETEIDEIVASGEAKPRLVIRSPHRGHVFGKQILTGDHIEAGQTLFEVADLSTVWIEGDVYEKDASLLRRGQEVDVSLVAFPGRTFPGRLHLVHPHVATQTRTLRVRFELENPEHELRPGMFATLQLKTPLQEIEPFATMLAKWKSSQQRATEAATTSSTSVPDEATSAALIAAQKLCPVTGARLGSMGAPVYNAATGQDVYLCCAGCEDELVTQPEHYLSRLHRVTDEGVLAVPELSVIDTGNQQVVYVEREEGLFEGVEVTLGLPAEGYYPVIDGLLPGDRVAAAGAFLVDAETRLNPAAAATYFGASGTSKESSPQSTEDAPDESARRNLARLAPADRVLAIAQRLCPVTDKPLGSMGVPYKVDVQGRPLFVCCRACEPQVLRDPEAALQKLERSGRKK